MLLDEEIEWWTNVMHTHHNEIGFVALGMATGLKLAKTDYGATMNKKELAKVYLMREALMCVRNQGEFLDMPRYVRELVDRAIDASEGQSSVQNNRAASQ